MTEIKIENIVASSKISELLDIELISEKIPSSSYNPGEFDGLSIKYPDSNIAVIVLSTGKVICTGSKDYKDAETTIKKVANQIKKIGFEVKKEFEITIENVIATKDFAREMHLSSIATALVLQNVEYKPEDFPGLVYKMDDLCAVLILFNSGKLVCTGAKSIDDAKNAIKMMGEKLSSIGVL